MCVCNPDGKATYEWIESIEIPSAALLSGYREWVRGLRGHGIKGAPNDKFWQCMSELGMEVMRSRCGNHRVLPPHDKYMELLTKLL
jgi:hypothetical protein